MEKTILILNEELANNGLARELISLLPDYRFEEYKLRTDILSAIENRFYTVAIVEARSLDLVDQILQLNPIAKVIIVSGNTEHSLRENKSIWGSKEVLDFIDVAKEPLSLAALIAPVLKKYYQNLADDVSILNASLLQNYSEAKNETDTFKKGILFERFISLLFGFLGYREITRRILDSSRNEIDLSIRNEISDPFLNKFGKYILMECKNIPNYKVSKNDFIVFNNKLKNSNGLSEFGIIATTGGFAKTTYQEAIRESATKSKILFLSNVEFLKLIQSDSKLEEFKRIIDEQVKSN